MFLIVLFGVYLTYEKLLINRLRLELAQNQSSSALWRDLALIDPLTGLFNRRYAEKRLKEEISRSQRKGYPLTLVMFDLNDFKRINDQFGHSAGDVVLKAFSDCLSKAVREADLAARLGGDEFVMLLTECDAVQAEAIVNRLNPPDVSLDGQRVRDSFCRRMETVRARRAGAGYAERSGQGLVPGQAKKQGRNGFVGEVVERADGTGGQSAAIRATAK